MIPMEENMTPHDVKQWLRDGYFYFRPCREAELEVGSLAAWPDDGSGKPYQYIVRSLATGAEYTYPDLFGVAYPHWPMCGALNVPTARIAVFLERLQQKQWKRTYNGGQLSVSCPMRWEAGQVTDALNVYSEVLAKQAFSPYYPQSITETKELFASGWFSVAVSHRVIVVNLQPRRVFFGADLVGLIDNGKYSAVDKRYTVRVEKALDGRFDI